MVAAGDGRCLDEFKAKGVERVVVLPIGFVDHMEVLYDLDEELVEHAKELNINMRPSAVEIIHLYRCLGR